MIDEDDIEVIATIIVGFSLITTSFLVTAGVFWLVCLCFGWEWSWMSSIGVWLMLVALKAVVGRSDK